MLDLRIVCLRLPQWRIISLVVVQCTGHALGHILPGNHVLPVVLSNPLGLRSRWKRCHCWLRLTLCLKSKTCWEKELELSLEKESLELSTKLAIATAKEEVLLDFSVENSVVTTSQLDKKTSDTKFKMVTDHIGQTGVEFVHPTTDSVCPVKIEMDSCTRQASLPENSETRRVEFTERKVDFGHSNLNFSSGQTVVKSASTPVNGLVEKQDEDQVCSPLLVHNAAVSAAAGDLNTTDFSRYETRLCLLIRFVWNQEAQMLHIHFPLQWQWHTS